jgi:iron(III) transport system ATP-binding protein
MHILECQQISKSYGPFQAVRRLNLSLEQGLIYALLGPSGCGKTTTIRLIAGLEIPQEGKIFLREQLVNSPQIKIPPEKRGIGMVFQNLALWPHMTVERNLTFGLYHLPRKERMMKAKERLEIMGLTHRLKAYPHELSEGERQRVALGRALIQKPDFLLLDEPFANLDRPLKEVLLREIVEIGRRERVTILFVTHEQYEALTVADKLLIMNEGKIIQEGSPEEIYRYPSSPFVACFLGPGGLITGEVREGTILSPLGCFPCKEEMREGEIFLLFRPEDIRVSHSDDGIKALVRGGQYQGGRWQWRVEVEETILSLWAQKPPPVGETVLLEIVNPPFLLPGG